MATVTNTRPVDLKPFLKGEVTPTNFGRLVKIAAGEVDADRFSVSLGQFWNKLYRSYNDPAFKSNLNQKQISQLDKAFRELQGIRAPLAAYGKSQIEAQSKATLPTTKPAAPKKDEDLPSSRVAEEVIAHKRVKKAEADVQKMKCHVGPISFDVGPWKETTHPMFWIADIFEAAYLGYEGVLEINGTQSLGLPGIDGLFVGLSIVGGLLFILNSIPELVNGFRALANGDKVLALRMIVLATVYFFIGTVIFAASILKYAGVATFITTNPWILPVLYLIPCLCNLAEILSKVVPFAAGKDLVSRLNLKGALEILDKNEATWKKDLVEHFKAFDLSQFDIDEHSLAPCRGYNQKNILIERTARLSQKMEDFQSAMGVTAGIEAFELMILILKLKEGQDVDIEQIKAQIKKLDHEDTKWWQAQAIRLTQQLCVLGFFGVTMAATFGNYSPEMKNVMHGRNSIAMCAERIIPLYMDVCRPFERNTTLVTERVNERNVCKGFSQFEWNFPEKDASAV